MIKIYYILFSSHQPWKNESKKRDAAGPNEMVACTSCGGNSPCTHSANNGCATEVCR